MKSFTMFLLIILTVYTTALFSQNDQIEAELDKLRGRKIPTSLLNEISVHIDNEPMELALADISEKGGLNLSYNRHLLPLKKKVSVHMYNVYAIKALLAVLQQTSSTLQITNNGALAIMPAGQGGGKKHSGSFKGLIKGVVTDSSSGEPLPGANVLIKGTSIGAATNLKGEFTLPKILPGTYTIKITYIGYKDKEIKVRLGAGKTVTLEAPLSWVAVKGRAIQITAQAEGQTQAINRQISERSIVNIVSATKIRELPDENAAAALARLPGVSVERKGGEAEKIRIRGVNQNVFYVNGMRMEGSNLAAISSSMIGGIEIQKSFSPDQDADITGGAVRFRMLKAPSGFKKDIWLRTGYNDFTKSYKIHNVSMLLSNRFFHDRLGINASLSYDRRDRGSDQFTGHFQTLGSSPSSEFVKPTQISGADLYFSQNLRDRYGATLYADYRIGRGTLFYQGFWGAMQWDEENLRNGYSPLSFTTLSYNAKIFKGERLTNLNGIGGEHTFLGNQINWSWYLSVSEDDVPHSMSLNAINSGGITGVNAIDTTTTFQELFALATHDLDHTPLSSAYVNSSRTKAKESTFKLDITRPFALKKYISGSIKFGGKSRNVHRLSKADLKVSGFYGDWVDGTGIALKRLPDFGWKRSADGKLGLSTFVDEEIYRNFTILDQDMYFLPNFDRVGYYVDHVENTFNRRLSAEVDNYDSYEQFYAGYIMGEISVGSRFHIVPGVRYEYQKFTTTGIWFDENKGGGPLATQGKFKEVTGESFNEHWFPMTQLKLNLTKFSDIRFAYSKTVSRPDYRHLSPKWYEMEHGDRRMGNLNLKPQTNYNYDVYLSFYSNHIGLFTLGAFYKKLTDQVLNYEIVIINPEDYGLSPSYQGKSILQPVNNKWPGFIKGLEVEWQTHFWYLPGFLNGFVLNANLTLMDSETRYPFFSFQRVWVGPPKYYEAVGVDSSRINKVIGMPSSIANLTLGYEKGGFSSRLSMYYQGPTIQDAQRQNKALDVSTDDLVRFDVQISQKAFFEGLTFYLNINNLTNWPDRQYLTYFPQFLAHQENYGWTADIGLRYRF